MVSQLFARRYLFSKNSRSVINIIAGVSIAAVAVPVAAMIILLSVFNGFEGIVRQLRSSFDADVAVQPLRGASFAVSELPKERILGVEGVEAASYVVEQGALAGYGGERTVVNVRGVDEDYGRVLPLAETLVAGEGETKLGEIDRIVLGRGAAYTLGVHSFVMDDVTLYAIRRNSFSTLLPVDGYSTLSLPVAGIFAIDAETDGNNVLTSLGAAQRLFDYRDGATSLLVKAADAEGLASLKKRIEKAAGEGFRVVTKDEANASLYRIMRYEKWGIFVIALLVLVIASLSIVGVLVMLILEKSRDIGTLRALGADSGLLRSIFRTEGMLICGIGGAAGLAAGIALSLMQQHLGIIQIPSATLVVSAYPVELRTGDVAVTAVVFVLVAWLISSVTVNSMIKRRAADKQILK